MWKLFTERCQTWTKHFNPFDSDLSKETSAYHLATFCIDLKTILAGPLSVKVGTSQLGTNPLGSVLHIKALPNFPYSLVYIDVSQVKFLSYVLTPSLSESLTIRCTKT